MSLTDYIKKNLIAGFHSGQIGPGELTLVDLSARYRVSVTPVRAAVKQLIHEGYLEQQSNRRLVVRMDRAGNAGDDPSAAEPPKDWYRTVANDLVRLSLRASATAAARAIDRREIRNQPIVDPADLQSTGRRRRAGAHTRVVVGDCVRSRWPTWTPIRTCGFCWKSGALELAWPRMVDAIYRPCWRKPVAGERPTRASGR